MNHQASRQQSKIAQVKSWKQTLLIDKRQVQSFEKDLPKQFTFSLTIPECAQIVSKMLKETQSKDLQLQKQHKKISSRLNELNSGINQLKQTLKYYQYTNQYLVKVQNLSEGVYGKIDKIKQNMATQFQSLLDSEEAIQNDLKLYDHKINLILSGEYEAGTRNQQNQANLGNKQNKRVQSAVKKSTHNLKPQLNIPKPNQPHNKQNDQQTELKEVLQQIINQIKTTEGQVQFIEAKINSLGKNLGWNEEDHIDFIKIWNRCQGKNYFQIESELAAYFKLYTEEQTRDHMNKYMKFKQFNEEKKQKIIQYKHFKQLKKYKEFEILSLQQERQKKLQNKHKNLKNNQEDQIMMKQKVDEWKKIKEQKKLKQQQIKKEQEQRKYQQKVRKAEQNMYKKEYVQKWKEEQQQKKTQRLRDSRDTKRTMNPIDKETEQRIRQRQEKLIAEKVQKLMKKKYQEEEKLQKQQRLKEKKMVKYSYVNSKIQQKTTAVKEKQREKFDGKNKLDANTFGGNLLHHGIRATPGWMQGL